MRKLPSDDWVDGISGTLGIAGTADGLIGLFRKRGESDAVLKVTGRDLDEQELSMRFDTHIGAWTLLGESLGETGDALLRALRKNQHEGMGRKEMSDFFGRHKPSEEIDEALDLLRQKGLAHSIKESSGGRPTERWYPCE